MKKLKKKVDLNGALDNTAQSNRSIIKQIAKENYIYTGNTFSQF